MSRLGATAARGIGNLSITFDDEDTVMNVEPSTTFPAGETMTITWDAAFVGETCRNPVATPSPAWTYLVADPVVVFSEEFPDAGWLSTWTLEHDNVCSGYGDWVDTASIGANSRNFGATSRPLMGTAYLYNNCRIVERAARILGKLDDLNFIGIELPA